MFDILERIWGGEEVSDEDKESFYLIGVLHVVEPNENGKPNMWRIYIVKGR